MSNPNGQLLEILATLEKCREGLWLADRVDTARLASVAILDLRMKLNLIYDSELKALCEEIILRGARHSRSSVQRRRPLLPVVK